MIQTKIAENIKHIKNTNTNIKEIRNNNSIVWEKRLDKIKLKTSGAREEQWIQYSAPIVIDKNNNNKVINDGDYLTINDNKLCFNIYLQAAQNVFGRVPIEINFYKNQDLDKKIASITVIAGNGIKETSKEEVIIDASDFKADDYLYVN